MVGMGEKFKTHIGVNTLFHVPGDVGGTETYLRELLLAILSGFPDVKITLFTQLDNHDLALKLFGGYSNVSFCCIPIRASCRPLRIVSEQLLLPLAVWKSGVETLWSPGYTAPYFSCCPQIVTVHDLQYKNHPDDLTWLERSTLNILVRMACKKSEAIVAVSEFSKNEIVKHRFAAPAKVHAVLEGVDRAFSIPVTDETVQAEFKRSIPNDVPYILCVAHTYPHKNVDLLIDAFNEIQHSIPHNLVVVGKQRLGEPTVEAAIARLGETVRFCRLDKGVSFDFLRLLYQQADLFVLPSSYEGFGLPVLEAMMAGTEVVCSDMASLPEVGGEHVHYVRPLSASMLGHEISQTLNKSSARLKESRQKMFSWASTFTWDKAAYETLLVIASCVNK